MQVRGGYTSMAVHALNGIVGAVDNIGGTLKSNKEYTSKFPSEKPFVDDIAKKGKKHEKIDQRGRLQFGNHDYRMDNQFYRLSCEPCVWIDVCN